MNLRQSRRRRICPGRHYAEGVVFINLASILHVFDVSAPRARNDQPIVHEMRASDGYLLYVSLIGLVVRNVLTRTALFTGTRNGVCSPSNLVQPRRSR